jgi:putative Mg2+ transporter-C (MgtC) family protein
MVLNAATPLHMIDGPILLRLGAAAFLGLLLGLDRELRGHAAGLRTHGILCFTCALMTISAIALHNLLSHYGNIDPLRIFEASAAFTGIIAAGLIVFNRGEVKNLTTAAHIWLAAMIGIACGAGQWPLVISAAIIAVLMLTLLGVAEDHWFKKAREREGR